MAVRWRSNTVPSDDVDPLTLALQPPANETPEERVVRLREEAKAKAISDKIDDQIRIEREEVVKRKKNGVVKILLLGQSESGKSTTIKNFQILYSPNAWRQERISWRGVIYLNLVRSVRRILAALEELRLTAAGSSNGHHPILKSLEDVDPANAALPTEDFLEAFHSESSNSRSRSQSQSSKATVVASEPLPPRLLELSLRLAPLAQVEALLIGALSSDDSINSNLEAAHLGTHQRGLLGMNKGEIFVSATRWRNTLKTKISKGSRISADTSNTSASWESEGDPSDMRDIIGILRQCKQDMIGLWTDPLVQGILSKRRVRPQDSSGFFLNDIARLTEPGYIPTDQDVLNARLKTLGIVEHVFRVDRGSEKGINWTLYDVGGARNQRHAWASFFDDVDSIIFLAPISAFNQVLSEDPSVNRVADSLLLFRAICGNKLLRKVNIILFLNKIDILKTKLESGIQLKKFMLSYGDKPNDLEHVCKYFKSKFGSIFRELSDSDRELYTHFTTVNDPKSTSTLIKDVRDIILRKYLHKSSLLY